MNMFGLIVVLHVLAGTVGLISFWVPIGARKGGVNHRRWGRVACRALMGAGALAIAMALLSLYGPEQRLPMIRDRVLFRGLFGWMMLYLGALTIAFAHYGQAVVAHRGRRAALRGWRHQSVAIVTVVLALNCGIYGLRTGQPLMALVALVGIVAVTTQLVHMWRRTVPMGSYIGEHFRSLIGMGISAYTAFLSVGMIRLVPDHVFNPLVWAVPSVVGVGLIIRYTARGRTRPA